MIRWMKEGLPWIAFVASLMVAVGTANAANNVQLSEAQLAVVKKLGDYFNSLTTMKGEYVTDWNEISAAAILIAVPILVIYLFLERYLVGGLTAGAEK